ncbi:MAG: hypothetical protein AMS16_03020 [Planctomycetes bacterium DG_58]|nr:MAG: hypothetical protein AMS16_03020 [Planctomycetes bacterium DG_58]
MLGRFEGPPQQFMHRLLDVQCKSAPAEAGAILLLGDESVRVVAVHPEVKQGAAPEWLRRCVESVPEVARSGKPAVIPLHAADDLYGQPARRQLLVLPLATADFQGAAAFVVVSSSDSELGTRRERLELTPLFMSLYGARVEAGRRSSDLERLRIAMQTLAAVNEHARFKGAAMALCNEIASRWRCDRVGLGILKGRYVQLKALSHTEKFSRKMALVQDIEAAMEECLDQDVEVLHPSAAGATYVSRAAQELSTRHGPTALVSLPLRRKGEAAAVLAAERPADQPFALEEIESLRLACDLCTPRVMSLSEQDRWLGARAATAVGKGAAALVGPKHTWAKLTVILIFAAILFLAFAKGDYRAEAPFIIEATERQVIPAPFDGYLKSVSVEPGDVVEADKTVLATLDTAELRLELASKRAEVAGFLKQAAAAMRDGKTVEAQIAQAQADKTRAQMRLLEHRIRQATIVSPLAGCVVTGELKRQIGAPVKTRDVLFEIAPLESLRAVLSVPEDLIADVSDAYRRSRAEGKQLDGELAAAARPDTLVRCVVERINPVAEVVNQRNVFKVRVRLLDTEAYDWMQPGMEGVSKTHIGRRRYVWIWTRRLVNWLRMKLWM